MFVAGFRVAGIHPSLSRLYTRTPDPLVTLGPPRVVRSVAPYEAACLTKTLIAVGMLSGVVEAGVGLAIAAMS